MIKLKVGIFIVKTFLFIFITSILHKSNEAPKILENLRKKQLYSGM